MRKMFLLLILLFVPCFMLLAADEDTENEQQGLPQAAENEHSNTNAVPNTKDPFIGNRFVLGAGFTWTNNPKEIGGHFDFGIVLYKRILYIQNNFMIRGGGLFADGIDYSIFTFSDKLIFGRNAEFPLKLYTYVECGAGIFGNQSKKFFDDPFVFTAGFGGGGEIYSENFGGIYIEVGYIGQRAVLNYPVSGIIIQTGWRIFF